MSALLIVGAYHQPWFDEAQAWLIARDASPWRIVSQVARHEGSPALWQLLLWTLERAHLPYAAYGLVSTTLAAGGAALVLYRSPFPLAMRVGIVFSYFFAYQFSLLARNYALDLLLFPAVASAWPARFRRPGVYAVLLGLLANTSAHAFLLCLSIGAAFGWDLREKLLARDTRAWLSLGLCGALMLAAVLQAWPSPDVYYAPAAAGLNPGRAIGTFEEALIDRLDIWSFAVPNGASQARAFLASLLVFAPLLLLCIRARLALVMAGGVATFAMFCTFKFADPWHAGVLQLFIITVIWMAWPAVAGLTRDGRLRLFVALGAILLWQDVGALKAWAREFRQPYSAAPAAAQTLQRMRRYQPQATLGALGDRAFGVQPWFAGNVIANHGPPNHEAYYVWSRTEPVASTPTLADWRALLAADYDRLLLSNLDRLDHPLADYTALARRAGYSETTAFPGELDWRGYKLGGDAMVLFAREPALRPASP